MRRFAVLMLAVIFCIGLLSGCKKDDPVTPKTPVFKDLANKENVIYNLVKSYEKADIDHYCALLHDDYLWFLPEEDAIDTGIDSFTWTGDSTLTANMFAALNGERTPEISDLSLEIFSAIWTVVDTLNGIPCTDCWSTTREYQVTFIMNSTMYYATGGALFVVVPVSAGSDTEYRLRYVYDLGHILKEAPAVRQESAATWSRVKLLFE